MLIRKERPSDVPAVRAELSLVAESGSGAEVVGHVIAAHGRL
ncbi:hypothetical protein [Promicromonospora iranensis]|uniref:N-acetyltransferase YhbS n=1 Tax=Promicromonospora iranensis TaxID=1105144 RepID=A0ABU2CUT7_9MICO|nr:hypothetical protein [Promicromonospora iranensis]MDR7385078.1 putative N-acetyltransferase YhbS [Promicromonospora iranensis]